MDPVPKSGQSITAGVARDIIYSIKKENVPLCLAN
jgi:hypothetical protein